jgi:hypothetical protein
MPLINIGAKQGEKTELVRLRSVRLSLYRQIQVRVP